MESKKNNEMASNFDSNQQQNNENLTELEKELQDQNMDNSSKKLKASEVYESSANELQAEKSEEVFEETVKEVEPPYEEPEREINQRFATENQKLLLLRHIGKAFGNMSIVFLSFVLLIISGQFILGIGTIFLGFFLAMILFVLSVVTLGIIYIGGGMGKWWGYVSKLFEGGTDIINFLSKLYVSFPFVLGVGLLFSIISIITTSKSGVYKSKGRIVFSSIICGISAILLIILVAGGLSAK